jgi:hypothetical protein
MTTEQHPNRKIVKAGENHWVVHCKRCDSRRDRKHFDSPQACQSWYVEHAKTDRHRNFERKAWDESPEVVALRGIFEKS